VTETPEPAADPLADQVDELAAAVPDDQYSRVADLLRSCRRTMLDIVEERRWSPAPDSQAEKDQRLLTELDPNESVLDHLSGFNLVQEVAITNLDLASLHVRGMASLYDDEWLFLTPDVLARAVVEALGHAVWVLGTADTTARQRLARAYILHVDSAARDKELDGLRHDDSREGARRLREARDRCRMVFDEVTTRTLEEGHLDGEKLPGPTAMVKLFLDTTIDRGGLVAKKKHTDRLYGYLSSAAHPTLFRLRQLRRVSEESAALKLEVEPRHARQPALLTAMLFYIVLRSFVNYFGYPPERCERLADQIDEVFPGSMV
jgi:hypothetical protein